MAIRRNAGLFEALIETTARVPWWIGGLLAVVAYGILHYYAVADVLASAAPASLAQVAVARAIKAFATFGQYILPLLLLAGAAVSFLQRRKRATLFHEASSDRSGDAVREMTWQNFERPVGEAFRRRGFSVVETGSGGADGGINLKLRKDGESFLVQCKQWRTYKVSVSVVRELYGVMAAEKSQLRSSSYVVLRSERPLGAISLELAFSNSRDQHGMASGRPLDAYATRRRSRVSRSSVAIFAPLRAGDVFDAGRRKTYYGHRRWRETCAP